MNAEPVLIVDDTPAVLRIMRTLLGGNGVTDVDSATGGPDAVRKLGARRYRIVMCKRTMQPMNAIDLRLVMRNRPEWSSTPLVVMTSDPAEDLDRLRQNDIPHVLRVPFSAEAMFATMRAALAGSSVEA